MGVRNAGVRVSQNSHIWPSFLGVNCVNLEGFFFCGVNVHETLIWVR
jgi:hypothetical protein